MFNVTVKYCDWNVQPPIKKQANIQSDASNESKAFKEAVGSINEMFQEIYSQEGDQAEDAKKGCSFTVNENQFNQKRIKDFQGKVFVYSKNGIEILVQIQ